MKVETRGLSRLMLEREESQVNNESWDAYPRPRASPEHGSGELATGDDHQQGGCHSHLGENLLEESYCFL